MLDTAKLTHSISELGSFVNKETAQCISKAYNNPVALKKVVGPFAKQVKGWFLTLDQQYTFKILPDLYRYYEDHCGDDIYKTLCIGCVNDQSDKRNSEMDIADDLVEITILVHDFAQANGFDIELQFTRQTLKLFSRRNLQNYP